MRSEMVLGGIEPEDVAVQILKNKTKALLELSPSDSTLSSRLTRTKIGYLGILQVFSTEGKFTSEGAEHSLEALIHSLFQLMNKEIVNWRATRFLERE